MSVCIYAIVPGRSRIAGRGAAREALRVVSVGSVAAVVGRSDARRAATRERLVAYDAAIRRIAVQTSALLPARFNTLVGDDEEVRLILSSRGATLRRALARVRRRAQMTVRMTGVASGGDRGEDGAIAGAAQGPNKGTQFLRARAAAHRVPEFDDLRPAVARWIRDERTERRGGVATIYHLVPRGAVTAYRKALMAAAAGRLVAVSGPFPPYAFADSW